MRLRILQAVRHGPLRVGEIVTLADSTQADASKHLARLGTAGVVRRERDGQRVLYEVRNDLALKLCGLVGARLDS